MQVNLAPASNKKWKIGIIGCGWIGGVHCDAAKMLPNAEVVACCDTNRERAESFAKARRLPKFYTDHKALLEDREIEVVITGIPNFLHHKIATDAMTAGKHVIIEKPLAMSLEECESLIETSKRTGKVIGYAEELCFVPKFARAKELVEGGSLGKVMFVKQIEKHEGPYSRWFFEPDMAGGGITIDMGCHSIEFARWFLGKPKVKSVWSTMSTWLHKPGLHENVTEEEDHVIIHLEFEGGATALLESSWTLKGGMDSRTEIHGTSGVLYADLLQSGMGMKLYTDKGIKGEESSTKGWSHPDVDWNFQNGYPHELAHFLHCMETGKTPIESAEDGLAVMEIMLACYYSAGTGNKVELPFRPKGIKRPIDLWKNPGLIKK